MKKVQEKEFWKERLEEADQIKKVHYSVYNANDTSWDYIVQAHGAIINSLVKGKVLDAGCGYGRLSEQIDEYTGVDLSPDLIERAKTLYPNKTFIQGELQKLPFEDKEFDWAICASVKNMIIGNGGGWDEIEKELKRVSRKVLVLEYSSPEVFEIL